jgi:thymidylate synthase
MYSEFGNIMKFDLSYSFPLLTTKKIYWKGVVEELLFFLRG